MADFKTGAGNIYIMSLGHTFYCQKVRKCSKKNKTNPPPVIEVCQRNMGAHGKNSQWPSGISWSNTLNKVVLGYNPTYRVNESIVI